MRNILVYFLTGGIFTTIIVLFEENGSRLLSGFAALMPIFTLVSYIFIGSSSGGADAVSQHAKFVLWGTVVAWIPYMLAVIYLSPRLGTSKALVSGLVIFFVLAGCFIFTTSKYHLFQ